MKGQEGLRNHSRLKRHDNKMHHHLGFVLNQKEIAKATIGIIEEM